MHINNHRNKFRELFCKIVDQLSDLEKRFCRRSLLSRFASCRPTVLVKTNSFTGKEPFNNGQNYYGCVWVDVLLESVKKKQERMGFYSQYELRSAYIFSILHFSMVY